MLKVLIADDEEKICQLIIKLINWEEMGLKIAATASNGIEALEQAKICKPEILITDIRMPGIDGMELIRLEHVTKSFGTQKVLDDLSFTVNEGEFLTVIGRSGCGKTTMLRMINGLQKPDEGSVYVEGEEVAQADLIALRRRIGYVIQNKGLFPHMTVEKNISYVPVISGKKDREANHRQAMRLLKVVGLEESMAGRYPSELSGGQQQRVGIARALASEAKILLMDEPFGALDEITKRALQNELLALQEKLHMTVVFITHDIREALKLGDRVLVMEQGRIAQLGTPEEIRKEPVDDFVEGTYRRASAASRIFIIDEIKRSHNPAHSI